MELIHKELTEKIIGALFEVHKSIGPGLTEIIYRRALLQELKQLNLKAEAEKECLVYYKGRKIGSYRLDIVVEDKVVLELKVTSSFEPIHEAQMLAYLRTTKYKVGLLVNFGKKSLEFKRFVETGERYESRKNYSAKSAIK